VRGVDENKLVVLPQCKRKGHGRGLWDEIDENWLYCVITTQPRMPSDLFRSIIGSSRRRRGSDNSEGDDPSFSCGLRDNEGQERGRSRPSLNREYSSSSWVSRLGTSRYEQDARSYYASLHDEARGYRCSPSPSHRLRSPSPPPLRRRRMSGTVLDPTLAVPAAMASVDGSTGKLPKLTVSEW
jgi:hypothetical protein